MTLHIEDDGVARLGWSRPAAANAFDEALVEGLLAGVERAAADGARMVVLTGSDGRFSAGFDLRGEHDDRELAWRFARCEELLAAVRGYPGVTVASVVGPAFGAGADLVTACDYRLGDGTARFRFPGPRFGIVLGTHQLRAVVGRTRAMDIVLRGETVDASTAMDDGLLTHRLEADDHAAFVRDLAADIADLDSQTLRTLVRVIRPSLADESHAELSRSAHRPGLSKRIEAYRRATLR